MRCSEREGTRTEEEAKTQVEPRERALELGQCQGYLERTLRREFRAIVQGFVNEARNGSCAHMKLTAELLQTAREKKAQRRKSTAQRLWEELGE